jgi:2-keto-4-pentenoate hydratase/2-oxohepta-3-ene-1,7-dioic acid hydratase in catechol pathway
MRFMVGTGTSGHGVFLVEGQKAHNLTALDPRVGQDLMGLITGAVSMDELKPKLGAAKVEDISAIKPAMPVARPGKTVCLGLNYVDHIKEGGYDVPTYPALFMRVHDVDDPGRRADGAAVLLRAARL